MRSVAVLWLAGAVWLNCAGWALAALHQLNPTGWAVALLLGIPPALLWLKKNPPAFFLRRHLHRFRRLLPGVFLLLACLIFLGGLLYPPSNYDALSYRLPRILNWLSAGSWYWIPTINDRMNCANAAWEWMAMPLLALTHSDRALFLINFSGFLLMPGLVFSIFRRLVANRVAWTWMWILPLTYGYATQAGSIGNDLTGTLLCLLSVFFGLQARRSGRVSDVWLAMLAAALMTGVKVSNAPLVLPCLVAVWPALAQLRKHVVCGLVLAGTAVVISAAPTMVLNQLYTGSWTGDPQNRYEMQAKPAGALLGNGLLLAQQSFMPPVLPGAHKVDTLLNRHLPAAWQQTLKEKFPRYYLNHLNELPQEETAGLGLGVTLLLLGGAVAALLKAGEKRSLGKCVAPGVSVGLAAWGAMLFYMLKMGSEATARLLLPYYPLAAVPILLLPGQNALWKSRAWKIFAAVAALSAVPAIIFSPSRPLFPISAMERFLERHSENATAQRLLAVYSAYAHRNDALAPLRAALPDNAKKIGYVAGSNDTDYSLWRPFGARQVVYLQSVVQNGGQLPDDIEWIVVKRTAWPEFSQLPLEKWAVQNHASIVLSVPIVTIVSWGAETWCLLHIERSRT